MWASTVGTRSQLMEWSASTTSCASLSAVATAASTSPFSISR